MVEPAVTLAWDSYQAFIFDFDGVLADSVEVKTTAFAMMFEQYGSEVVDEVVAYHRQNGGKTRAEKFKYYYQELLDRPLSEEQLSDLCKRFETLVVDQIASVPEITGAEKYLHECQNRLQCFVISATPDGELLEIVQRRGLRDLFIEICGSSKQKPEHLSDIVERYSFNPNKCLFFGDADSDYRAAKENDVKFLGIVPDHDAPLLKVAEDICWVKDFSRITMVER